MKEFYIEGTIKEVVCRRGVVTFTLTPTDEFVVNCKDSGSRKLLFVETVPEGKEKLPADAVLKETDVEFSLSLGLPIRFVIVHNFSACSRKSMQNFGFTSSCPM